MRFYLLLSAILFFIIPTYGINNLKQFITLSQLEKQNNVGVKRVLHEEGDCQWVVSLPLGTVINEGGILTNEGYILKDTQTSWNDQDQHRLTKKNRDLKSENPMQFDGRLAVISSPGSENWYHWLLQIIPRLMILKESGIEYDKIYINNLKFKWQMDSLHAVLNCLNIPEDKLLIINSDVIIQATFLIVPSIPFIPSKHFSKLPECIKLKLRSIFLDYNCSRIETNDRIYISRMHASCRRIINESQLSNELQKLGFKTVYLELLSPYDQARIFNNAKVIIGPHGSAFANLIFINRGCQLIEIDHGTNPSRSYYKTLASLMNCVYHPFYVDNTTEDHLEDDMTVDVAKFIKFLRDGIIEDTRKSSY